jgi:hypothetical protein
LLYGSSVVTDTLEHSAPPSKPPHRKRRRRWPRVLGISFATLVVLLVAVRTALPSFLIWYVNRTIDKNPLYDGKIGDIEVFLWRGAYQIKDIRLVKTTGTVPVPLFAAKQVDLAIQWDALVHGKVVGRIRMDQPELNFVDSKGDDTEDQTGAGGPWLQIIRELFPFKINRCEIVDGSIHFRAFDSNPPVDLYLTRLQAKLDNLTNIDDDVAPLNSTVTAEALAMDHAKFQYQMKMDPFSYRPSFEMAVRLIGLDVTKINSLTRAYGSFDFEKGWFDLVIELKANEGRLTGYVKPLFRNISVLSLEKDIKHDNVIEFFWEALVGVATGILKNPPRDQFGTIIPLSGDLTQPSTDILATIGNVLENAFVRAYMPRLQGQRIQHLDWLQFQRGSVTEPSAIGSAP